ncbi:MAG TPA: MFS transporter, partial [Bauldia sp.]|nr:MFS transporter [Bauldia sp.]
MSSPPPSSTAPRGFAFRMALFYFGYFMMGGVVTPFYPVWLQGRGLSEVEIANCIAIPALVRVLLTPFAGVFADRAPHRRFAAISLAVPGALIFLLAYPAQGYWPLLIITGSAFTLYYLTIPVVEALALTGVRRFGMDYGRLRVSGSIAFIIVNLGSGALLSLLHPEAIFWIIAATLFAAMAVSFALPVTPPEIRRLDDLTKPRARPDWRMLADPGFVALILVGALVQASHAVLYSFGSIHWRSLGFDGIEIGAFWAIGIVVEVAVFSFSGLAVRTFGPFGLLVLGGTAAIVRW